jgi:IS30 family transposase
VKQCKYRSPHRRNRRQLAKSAGLGKIPNRVGIAARGEAVDHRLTLGHWEGDTVLKGHKDSALVTLVERRSGLNGFTPAQIYTDEYRTVAKTQQAALIRYHHEHPEHFVRSKPESTLPPEATYINPITSEEPDGEDSIAVNFPTLPAARDALTRANRH